MGLIKLETAKGDFFFEEDYKVVLPNNYVNWTKLCNWCVENLKGEVISDCGPTNNRDMITWYFEYPSDATLFALRWS